jgi:cell wall assembly regulator SMI1
MSHHWDQIKAILREQGCLEEFRLNPGASPTELRELEAHLGVELPAAVKEFLSVHDGEDDSGPGLVFGLPLLSTRDIRMQWDTWKSLEDEGMNETLADSMSSRPEGYVKPLYLNPRWIPLTHDGGGNHIGIDLDPDVRGTVGQVIIFGRDEDEKKLLATSFEEFLTLFIHQLRTIDFRVTADDWSVDEKYGGHYHDYPDVVMRIAP